MLLIDAIYINNGGGKVLLDYLVDVLERCNFKVHYLLDRRIENQKYSIKKENQVTYLDASILLRNKFYKSHQFKKIFILGNIPPLAKNEADVYTYFHNTIYLNVPKEFIWKEKIKYFFKNIVISWCSKNTDYWLVQTSVVKENFILKFGQSEKLRIVPFFKTLRNTIDVTRKTKGQFLYVSNGQVNKNHKRLIDAFCQSYDHCGKGSLVLTLNNDFSELIDLIDRKIKQGYPIKNVGFLSESELVNWYTSSEFVIFPSLTESFGLGIVEGIQFNCKVIGAALPYTYAICEPSFVFNPKEISSIRKAINFALFNELPVSASLIKDEIHVLIHTISQGL